MKQFISLFVLLLIVGCGQQQPKTKVNDSSENRKLERYFEKLLGEKVTATIYIVHPEVCGACSNDFLVKMAKQDLESKFYLLATGPFKKEHEEAAERMKGKIRFVDGEKLGRIGLNAQFPQKLIIQKGKIQSIEVIKL